jgi:TolB-like protein/DNA-binding winged helix-turn-helix (wHTH) protein/Tfp pilus assembly protein PilF
VPEPQPATFRFGPYESRSRTRELYKYGLRLKIRPQPWQVLNLLLSRAGDVVSREELHRQLWPSETFVDFEHGLNNSVKELRAVLGDSVSEPRYIETLPKLGYRFVAAVEVEERPAVDGSDPELRDASRAGAEGVATPKPSQTPLPLASARGTALVALSLFLLVCIIVGIRSSRSPARPRIANNEHAMVAVLPFENLTGDPAQEYFSDGLTEEMIAQLGHTDPQHLGVIARTSVMRYKNTKEQTDQIGHELGAQYLLEGSVRRDADKMRITAQLTQTKDQTRVWSHQYDRTPNSLLSLQDEIAQEISDAIQQTLGEHKLAGTVHASPAPSPKSYEAYDLYLKGRYFWNKRTPDGFERAAECFNQAIAKDPQYALAYAGLADTYALTSGYTLAPPAEFIPKARAAALKALQLDEQLAEAHVSLAVIAQNYDWDWQTAEKEYRRAIELDPNYATAHHWYAENLALQGRFDEAFSEIDRARKLDPLSLIVATDNGVFLYFSRQYERAIEQFRAVLDMEPGFSRAHMVMSAYVEQGKFAEAIADAGEWRRRDDNEWSRAFLAYVYGRAGREADARRELERAKKMSAHRSFDPLPIALAYIGLKDKDQAFVWLNRAMVNRSPSLAALKVDPIYDSLRSDPRFAAILHHIGLAQ